MFSKGNLCLCFDPDLVTFPPIISNLTTKLRTTEQNAHQQIFWTPIILLAENIVKIILLGKPSFKKIYFAKKFHKTVTPPPVGVL